MNCSFLIFQFGFSSLFQSLISKFLISYMDFSIYFCVLLSNHVIVFRHSFSDQSLCTHIFMLKSCVPFEDHNVFLIFLLCVSAFIFRHLYKAFWFSPLVDFIIELCLCDLVKWLFLPWISRGVFWLESVYSGHCLSVRWDSQVDHSGSPCERVGDEDLAVNLYLLELYLGRSYESRKFAFL